MQTAQGDTTMTIYKKIPALNYLIPELTTFAEQELARHGADNIVKKSVGFLHDPIGPLDNILGPLGFPKIKSCILFSRIGNEPQVIHIDNTPAEELETVNCAINFPIENCNNYMYWYQGKYDIVPVTVTGPGSTRRRYSNLNWHTGPIELDKTIIDAPTLVNVSIPHNIQRVPVHRKLLTFRFVGNPKFQEIADLIDQAWPAIY
jgi:hypothetical protein